MIPTIETIVRPEAKSKNEVSYLTDMTEGIYHANLIGFVDNDAC
jgi:hypothetical protein